MDRSSVSPGFEDLLALRPSPAVTLHPMIESESGVQDWEHFKDLLRQTGGHISRVAQYLREGRGSREELADALDSLADLVGTTLPDMVKIS